LSCCICLQEDVADRILHMLRGALAEVSVGNPDRLATDVGPVIGEEARDGIEAHVRAMIAAGNPVHRAKLPEACRSGTFVAPTIVEIPRVSALKREVFGPVLHVVRFRRNGLDALLGEINATGYGLTFGLHTRIDETIARVVSKVEAGNIYVNRNVIGAVVGVQPFGGHGLSGTGPKAGGPLYLRRLQARAPRLTGLVPVAKPVSAQPWARWLAEAGEAAAAADFLRDLAGAPFEVTQELAGPVGERNLYSTQARGAVRCVAARSAEVLRQIGAALATGNRALVTPGALAGLPALPAELADRILETSVARADAVLFSGPREDLEVLGRSLADWEGPIVAVYVPDADGRYPLEWLVRERSVSINTTAAGGNANLMMIG
jgi:RHH-type proline utilization regulon transcriptional repressor/proline dehydrogenase/delta 1-pyrroline-5-carboxylate dehydrogenase